MSRASVLIVDDDANIRQLLRLYLEKEGHAVTEASDGEEAIRAFKAEPPRLVLLDVMLPGADGWQVCREIRKVSNIPIIMLTAKGETFDKVLGLELGADDYLVKPFDPKELLARIKAVLRRTQAGQDAPAKELVFPGLTINLTRFEVAYRGKRIEMPPKELELLYYLADHAGAVHTREQLLEQVWGYDFFGDSRTVDVHVKRLRGKLADSESLGWSIRTVWGVGYKFEAG